MVTSRERDGDSEAPTTRYKTNRAQAGKGQLRNCGRQLIIPSIGGGSVNTSNHDVVPLKLLEHWEPTILPNKSMKTIVVPPLKKQKNKKTLLSVSDGTSITFPRISRTLMGEHMGLRLTQGV